MQTTVTVTVDAQEDHPRLVEYLANANEVLYDLSSFDNKLRAIVKYEPSVTFDMVDNLRTEFLELFGRYMD